ncbi:hypothetical protein NC652_038473 [Populus alba x Populus x berolinensis]|uniref:Elongator complex protein 5 n=1 Tax=Populus tomentosa TaxID=118781 RepID=A0A8X8BZT8_POPTO|nr:hypothetical protein POTOM_054067 [Populus tomentosa]KAJ6867256.1 hypothetical protein NC652_038473 [Populus alba x Populus x berolinensis]
MCGTLRDGSLEGEQALALTIRDTTASPFGFHVLSQLSSFILASKSQSRIQILDCYSDPLGWKDQLMMSGNFTDVSYEASLSLSCVCRNVKDLDKLYSLILELGKGLFGQGKDCFSVAIDSLELACSHGWRAAMDPDGSKDMDMMLAILLEWHQGNGKPIQIHDSGRSLAEGKTEATLGSSWTSQKAEDYGEGDIIYFLDSDDEMPDSDEDSDDDLDV